MLTEVTTPVDGTSSRRPDPPRTVMWTIKQIAARDSVSKQAVSRKVGELVGLGLTVDRDGMGRVAAVNVVEYDRLRGRTDDPSKAQAPSRAIPAPLPAENESYQEALRQKTWHEAERQRLNLAERKGELIPVASVTDAIVACGVSIGTIIDRLPNLCDDLAGAFTRDGAHGLRVALKRLAFQQRSEIADALASIATAAPKVEPEVEESAELPLNS